MSDRLYTRIDDNRYAIFNFEHMEIREQAQDPHAEIAPGELALTPPFYVDRDTFYGVSERLIGLHKLNHKPKRVFPPRIVGIDYSEGEI